MKCAEAGRELIADLCAVGVFAIVFAYYVVAKENRARRKDSITLITIMGNQRMTTLQILGVLSPLLISWPEPFATVLQSAASQTLVWIR